MAEQPRTRVLVIEKDTETRKLAFESLRKEGFAGDAVPDGVSARELIRKKRYHVIVSDLQKSTVVLLGKVFQMRNRPLVVITTSEAQLVKVLMQKGADDVIPKPLETNFLAAKIRALVDRATAPASKRQAAKEITVDKSVLEPASSKSSQEPETILEDRTVLEVQSESGTFKKVTEEIINRKLRSQSAIQPISSAALLAYDLVTSEDAGTVQIAHAIGQDETLAVQVLKVSNSAYYNRSRKKFTRIEEAIVHLGRKLIGEMALAISIQAAFASTKLPWMDVDLAWQRGVAAGMAAKYLLAAKYLAVEVGEKERLEGIESGLFVSALSHLSGRVLLGTLFPQHYEAIIQTCREGDTPLEELEQLVFPLNQAEVMARQLQFWDVPHEVSLSLRYMMKDEEARSKLKEPAHTRVEILRFAALVAKLAIDRWDPWDCVPSMPSEESVKAFGITSLRRIVLKVRKEVAGTKEMLSALTEGGTSQKAPAAKSFVGEIEYFSLANDELVPMDELITQMGVKLTSHSENSTAAVLINGVGCSAELLSSFRDSDFGDAPLMILCNSDLAKHVTSSQKVVTIPARYDKLEMTIREFAINDRSTRRESMLEEVTIQ